MDLTLGLEIMAVACAVFYVGAKTIGNGEKELLYVQYAQIISKWMFLFFVLTASFELLTASGGVRPLSETNYYLQSVPVNDLNNMQLSPFSSLTMNKTVLSGQNSGYFLLAEYATNMSAPNLGIYSSGVYQLHIHASSNGSVRLFSQFWILNNTGHDADLYEIGTTPMTTSLTPNALEYTDSFVSNYNYSVNPSDRLAVYVFANLSAFSVPVNVTLYTGLDNNSHVSIPSYVYAKPLPEINALFDGILILWIIMFFLDLVLLLPRLIGNLKKRAGK